MPHLIKMPKFGTALIPDGENPRLCGWLVPGENCTELGYRVVRRAYQDIDIEEQPEGSNRGVRIDAMAKWAGIPLGSYWCGVEVGACFTDAGALVPVDFPATKSWIYFVEPPTYVPMPGDAILYGLKNGGSWEDRMEHWFSHHIELLVKVEAGGKRLASPRTIGGNRAWGGSASNNGQAVTSGPQGRKDILGYIKPTAPEA